MKYDYEYDNTPDNRLAKQTLPGGAEQTIEYDGLGRTKGISLNGKFDKDINYVKSGDHATNYVSSVRYSVNGASSGTVRYNYDKKGNITGIKENGNAARYTYDSLNRLIREDNSEFKENGVTGKTETYEYDNNGNILAKTKYAYTLDETLSGGTRIEYGYAQSGWRDRLVSYNGEAVEYNEAIDKTAVLGNPTTYRGKALAWAKGRNLVSYNGNKYTYNVSGIRIGKTANGIETTYYLDGTAVIGEERRNNGALTDSIYYLYGIDGITGFKHNGIEYVYQKNVQGDITHIFTKEGQLAVKYVYDAWGNHNVYTAAGYEALAKLNAFRYRGYYYDVETGLYYLQSRYYDPEVGRFINADDISYIDPESINGLNLYSYCGNNPVMLTDSTGHGWWEDWGKKALGWIVTGIIAAAAIATIVLAVAFTGGLTLSVLVGAGIGALAGIGVSIIAQGGFASADPWQVAKAGGIGATIGAVSGAVSWGLGALGQAAGETFGYALSQSVIGGLKVAKVFSATVLTTIGGIIGNIIGGIIGGAIGNYFANDFFGNQLNGKDTISQGVQGEIPNWLIEIFRWLIGKK